MARSPVLRAAETHALAYRQTWRGSVFSSFLSPVLFLAAMGLGLGDLVDDGSGTASLGGVDYLTFLAPGLLAAAAMQTAAFEAMWPVMAGIKWVGSYKAALATPITVADVALGQLLWIVLRVAMSSAIFVAVIVAFGAAESPWIVLAYPAAVLTGAAFAAPVAAYTAWLETEYGLSSLMRFGIIPMFLFSGTFFPVDQLPAAIRWLAPLTPLFHGVELCRGVALETITAAGAAGHVAYLLLWAVAGTLLAVRQFQRRLVA